MLVTDTGVKSGLPEGPWHLEPDRMQWREPDSGLCCLISRHCQLGSLCGYVGVQPGHPLYGTDYDQLEAQLSTHGGLTFSGHLPGADHKLWWLGFDCAHFTDLVPALMPCKIGMGEYRDFNYVQTEVVNLARQIYQKYPTET